MKGRFQWKEEITINAPSDSVWDVVNDISLIPQYHPDVDAVELIGGQSQRTTGTKYRCSITQGKGKGSCIEEVVECFPGIKISTLMGEDSWGIHRMLKNFIVDSTLVPGSNDSTVLRFEAFYDPKGMLFGLINFVLLRTKMIRRSREVMNGFKRLSEGKDFEDKR